MGKRQFITPPENKVSFWWAAIRVDFRRWELLKRNTAIRRVEVASCIMLSHDRIPQKKTRKPSVGNPITFSEDD